MLINITYLLFVSIHIFAHNTYDRQDDGNIETATTNIFTTTNTNTNINPPTPRSLTQEENFDLFSIVIESYPINLRIREENGDDYGNCATIEFIKILAIGPAVMISVMNTMTFATDDHNVHSELAIDLVQRHVRQICGVNVSRRDILRSSESTWLGRE